MEILSRNERSPCLSLSVVALSLHFQIDRPYAEKTGYLLLSERPLLMLAGDSFVSDSVIEPCIKAAIQAVERFVRSAVHIC